MWYNNINFLKGLDMMSISLQNDIRYAESILNNECKDKFRKVYTNTNENLSLLFGKIDLQDRNILTVLSSSDYLYMSYLFGAKNVDCFDINPLTFRYYYLRKWMIENGKIDIGFCSYEEILKILMNVKPGDSIEEKESLLFWQEIIPKMGENGFYNHQFFITIFNPFNNFYSDKLGDLSKILSSINPRFYSFDIRGKTPINLGRKYDTIFLSNSIDYYRDGESIQAIIHNLYPYVSEQGKIICAHIPQEATENYLQVLDFERKFFEQAFDFKMITTDEDERIKYYQYTKK